MSMYDSLVFWLFLLMVCTLVLLVETAGLIRGLLTTRQVRWSSSLIILPLVVSIWSLVVCSNIANRIVDFSHIGDIHFTIEFYRQILDAVHQIISDCQLQIGLIVAVFIFTLLLEKLFHLRYITLPTERLRFWLPTQDRIRYERN